MLVLTDPLSQELYLSPGHIYGLWPGALFGNTANEKTIRNGAGIDRSLITRALTNSMPWGLWTGGLFGIDRTLIATAPAPKLARCIWCIWYLVQVYLVYLALGQGILVCLTRVYVVYLVFWPGGLFGIDRTLIAKAPALTWSRCNLLSTDHTNVEMSSMLKNLETFLDLSPPLLLT